MLLIIDNKSVFIKTLEKILKKRKINYRSIRAGQRIDLACLKGIKGVILSGGSLGLYSKSVTNNFIALMNFNVPIIGFCMGHQLISVAFGGAFDKLLEKQNKTQEVIIDSSRDPIFKNLGSKIYLREKHVNQVTRLPESFKILAHSNICKIEAMRHKRKKIYGFQAHPEVSGKQGQIIISNFLKMCGIRL